MTTKAEREHLARVAALSCVVCRNEGLGESPALCHHVNARAMGRKASHFDVLPLCHTHHDAGIYGVSVHAGLAEWERRHGTEQELLAQVREELGP
jgi:hypothetical protein